MYFMDLKLIAPLKRFNLIVEMFQFVLATLFVIIPINHSTATSW